MHLSSQTSKVHEAFGSVEKLYCIHNVLINRSACILVPKKKCFSTHAEVCVVVSNTSLVPVRSATMKAGTDQSARIDTMLEVHGGNRLHCDTN